MYCIRTLISFTALFLEYIHHCYDDFLCHKFYRLETAQTLLSINSARMELEGNTTIGVIAGCIYDNIGAKTETTNAYVRS